MAINPKEVEARIAEIRERKIRDDQEKVLKVPYDYRVKEKYFKSLYMPGIDDPYPAEEAPDFFGVGGVDLRGSRRDKEFRFGWGYRDRSK